MALFPAASIGLACAGLVSCGQTGDLYLPEPAREIVTRPATTTPPPPPATPAPDSTGTADSPVTPPSPAPEVVIPKEQPKKKPVPQQ